MNPARWQQIKIAFGDVLQLEPAQRSAYIEAIGATDPDLRERVASLLLEHETEGDGFLRNPAVDLEIYRELVDIDADTRLGEHIGPYRLVQELGSGGMGEVYLAQRVEAEFDQRVAIKLIRSGDASTAVVSRFKSERKMLAALDHPNIAKLLDGGRTPQGQPYFVMEYVPGMPITEYCEDKQLDIPNRLALLIQVCDGVQYAHQNAIIHRDLKPSNILVVEVDGKPVPRIIDFGVAKTTTSTPADQTRLTKYGIFMGTPGYMSPEQADFGLRNVDTRTDVYSLGALLYVLLTGLHPFETVEQCLPPFEEWMRRLREEEPPRPSVKLRAKRASSRAGTFPEEVRINPVPADLDWITMKALERDRDRRYATPLELAADLRRYLNDEAVMARPASISYQMRKFVRRHRVATAFIGMVTVLSLVASAAALIAVKQKREAEHQAAETSKAQARLLIQAAAQRLKDADLAGAQGIILAVLTGSEFAQSHTPAAISVFQEIRAADAVLAVLAGHTGFAFSAQYSPDATRIVTASEDKTARIWDARTGAQLVVLSGHGAAVYSAAFSPDGTRIVTASLDRTARIWDARTGVELAVLSGHGNRVFSALYSPDGTRIVTASEDKTARIWDAHTGAELAVLSGHAGFVNCAAYSPNGTRIVTASADKTARIWDSRTGAQLLVLSGHGDRVNSAAFSPDGTRIVTVSYDKTARTWDARTGAQLAMLSGHANFVNSAAYSPDGTRIVTASHDKTARIWDARTGAQLAVLSGHGEAVYTAAYSPDGTRIVTASQDRTARIWELRAGAQIAVLSGHDSFVEMPAYSPDGTRIVTASADKTARIWDARTGAQLVVLSGHGEAVYSAAFSPDGTRIVTASQDRTARIWDAGTGAELAVLSVHAGIFSAAYSPDGTRIVTASADNTARVWDVRTGAPLAVLSGHREVVLSAAFSPDGTRIVTASWDKTARIWDARTGTQLAVLSGHAGFVNSATYSPDGTRIVTASHDKTARIWDARTGAQLAVLSGHGEAVYTAACSPDGTRIVTASQDRTARIWELRTGDQLAVLSGHGDAVESAAYSRDGTRIVTASDDKTARVWDARVPATVAAQILWDKAAETDPLSDVDRIDLGLLPDARVRQWGSEGSACDQATAAFYDPDRLVRGLAQAAIVAEVANSACSPQGPSGNKPRLTYQAARALLAKSDVKGARQQLELAVSAGYRAAQVDLANLLVDAPAGILDPVRAVALDQKAWQDGVPIAAYLLGKFFEAGVASQPDLAKAWEWYQKGWEAGEPHAVARFAERAEREALAETDPQKTAGLLLHAFSDYAAAAERAHDEDWPDDVWRQWRYRRATLARLLATEGMMQQVADAYAEVLSRKQR